MGQRDAAVVDIRAVLDAAGRFDAVAERLDGVRMLLAQLTFGGAGAGRAHIVRGEAVRVALESLGDDLLLWTRACGELAMALRGSADRYVAAESSGAARLG